ncbi:mRNA-binding ribosome synthesis protein [Martiniozyma asiatica (nom. inval.)]|nr:mRNA-binding ribosome synthesis protein [Martiniozyma asiatica]
MGKVSKATKKFQSKHLKDTLTQRRKVKEQKLKIAKRKGNKGESPVIPEDKNQKNAKVFDDMDVEEYFDKGMKVPEKKNKKKQVTKEEPDSESDSVSNDGLSDSEDEEKPAQKQTKNKKANAEEDASSSEEEDDIDMDALQKDDPEFYNYLKKNDKDLLDFQPVNPLDAMSDDEDEDDGQNAEADDIEVSESKKDTRITVDMKLIKGWTAALKEDAPSFKTLKNIVMAFKAALNPDDEEFKYVVTEENVFNKLMLLILQSLPLAIQKLTPYKVSSNGIRNITGNSKKIATITQILKSHVPSLLTLLSDISNTETAALVLQSVNELLPYLISMRKLLKQIVTGVVNIWSSAKKLETQIAAFAFMNNAAKEYPKATLEIILKSSYSSFVKNCRKTSVHSMPQINFQKNSAAELFGLNEALGYQIGFEFIRQLAIHLRNSVNNPTKDSYKTIYNWQFCHSLDFWSRVISTQCNPDREIGNKKGSQESPLRQLIYPLVQVTIGAIRLIPTAQFFPLRFYLIRSLIRLSQNTGVFIPMFPLISEVLHSNQFSRRPKIEQLQAVDFENIIKVNKQYLNTKVFVDGISEQVIELISEYFVLYSKSVAFPELTTPPLIFLRRYLKKSKNPKFNKQLSILVDKLTANSKFIDQKRSTIEYGPKNKSEVSKFLQDLDWEKTPLGAYVQTQRQVKEAQAKLLRESLEEEAREEEEKKAAAAGKDSDEEDIELDVSSDEE